MCCIVLQQVVAAAPSKIVTTTILACWGYINKRFVKATKSFFSVRFRICVACLAPLWWRLAWRWKLEQQKFKFPIRSARSSYHTVIGSRFSCATQPTSSTVFSNKWKLSKYDYLWVKQSLLWLFKSISHQRKIVFDYSRSNFKCYAFFLLLCYSTFCRQKPGEGQQSAEQGTQS